MSTQKPKSGFKVLWLLLAAGGLSLIGGGALFALNQTTAGGPGGQLGPGRVGEAYQAGERVDIWRNESWHPGGIVAADGEHYRVRYDRSEVFGAEVVDTSRLRHRD